MFKFLSVAKYKPLSTSFVQSRSIMHPQYPGKCFKDSTSTSLKNASVKSPLGTRIYQGDVEIFYDCGNVPNKFIEGKLVPFTCNYINEDLVAPIGNNNIYNGEQYEG